MRIIDQSWHWVQKPQIPLQTIEAAGRTCYKSEDKITDDSAQRFAAMLLKQGHESVMEHVSASIRFITNRGVTHELVRHRLCAFSQESTRYVRYSGDMEFIRPVWWESWSGKEQALWHESCESAEHCYRAMLNAGSQPQQAREILPNSLKTDIVMTANIRQWRHVFRLRCSKAAHPQLRVLMRSCLEGFQREFPVLFDDIAFSGGK